MPATAAPTAALSKQDNTMPGFQRVVIGSDHGGFGMKELLREHINARTNGSVEVKDVGCYSEDRCDYPDVAQQVAKECSVTGSSGGTLAVFVCGSGIGISIAANKVMGQDCCLVHDVTTAKYAREKMNTKAIALGGRTTGNDVAKAIMDVFLAS
ncbi:unnamed protein product [Amoebophrya sp. A120]|nr:unnamed protein product [Amoebophrya sp. A120]|eukprot:GSA120T00004357001.1